MRIRTATPADARRIAEIHVLARHGMTYAPRVRRFEEIVGYLARRLTPGDPLAETDALWVCERDGDLVGYAARRGGWLTDLYVHPLAQNRGIGAALLETARRAAPGALDLWVFQANDGAHRFYRRHGAALRRETDGAGNEERTPDALLRLPPLED